MKHIDPILLTAFSIIATLGSVPPAFAVEISEDIATTEIQASASSVFDEFHPVTSLIDNSGMDQAGGHGNNISGGAMWHTGLTIQASPPAPGLPESPAWVRFDFKEATPVSSCQIWNHNQPNLTNRGFRHARAYISADGTTFEKVRVKGQEVFEIPQAKGRVSEPVSFQLDLPSNKAIKSIIIAANDNWGGNVYGLSEVKFSKTREVALDDLPFPTDMTAVDQLVYRHRPDGEAGREVKLGFTGSRLYGRAELELKVNGQTVETHELTGNAKGLSSYTLLLPKGVGVEKEAQFDLVLSQGTKQLEKANIPLAAKRQWTVFIYPHSHVDIGYTQTQEIVEKITVHNLKVGMEIAAESRKNPKESRYVWNPEAVWATENFLKVATPEEKAQYIAAVKAGEVGQDANYAHFNTTVCSDEELLRFFSGGLRLRKLTGAPVDTMVQVDVPGASWGLVQAAAQCGIKGMLDFPNGFGRVGNINVNFQRPFYWVAPDGKKRLLYIQGPQYDMAWMWKGQFIKPNPYPAFPNPAPGWIQDYPPVMDRVRTENPSNYFVPMDYLNAHFGQIEREGLPYDYFVITWSMSDNSLVDADLPDAVKAWNKEYAYPKMVIASSREILEAYDKKFGSVIPEKRGDLTEYWTDGLGSDALRVGYNRLSKERLTQTEILWSMLHPSNTAPMDDIYKSWSFVTLGSEHTWGYFNTAHPLSKEIEATKASYFESAASTSKALLTKTLEPVTSPGASTISVLNALSWDRTGLVTLTAEQSGTANAVADDAGKPVLSQKLSTGELAFLATDIPALSSKTYRLTNTATAPATKPMASGNILENDLVKVTINPQTGDIASLVQKSSGHEFVDVKSPYAINSYRYLRGDMPGNQASSPTEVRVTIKENGPLVASLLVESKAEGCNKLSREIRIIAGQPQVELLNVVDKISTTVKEGIHFGFAFNIENGKTRMDIPWGVMTPQQDQLPGSNKNWLSFQRWIDISNDKAGVTWTATEAPLVELGEITANILGYGQGWRQTIPETQTLFSWALNNHWFTNFPLQQGGVIPFHYAILPHGAYDPVVANRFGLEQNRPLVAVASKTPLAPKAPVRLDNARIFLSTIKPSEDGKSTIVRLRSLSDKPETVKLDFPAKTPRSIQSCLADETPVKPAEATFEMLPYGCETLRLDF